MHLGNRVQAEEKTAGSSQQHLDAHREPEPSVDLAMGAKVHGKLLLRIPIVPDPA
jgi:hypothetical protein